MRFSASLLTVFAALPQKTINGIINDKWKGANFSQRVWANTSQTAKNAYDIVTRGIMTGANVRTMAQQLSETMQAGMYASMRLIRTETNRVHNAAEREAYKEEEVENYRFLATLDGRTCEQCGRLDGKTFPVEDAKEGVNFPPLHPNDRCTTVQAIDEKTVKNLKRRARDPKTDKTVTVPGNMTWEEWKKNVGKVKSIDNISDSSIINIKIDEFVPCLKDAETGKILATETRTLTRRELSSYTEKNGWGVNWKDRPSNEVVRGVFIKGDNKPQGLMSTRNDKGGIYIAFCSTAPQNNKLLNEGTQKYIGVGGHLFADAIKESLTAGNATGCIYGYAANEKLLRHYAEKLGAEHIPIAHEFQFVIEGEAAQNILNTYNFERR